MIVNLPLVRSVCFLLIGVCGKLHSQLLPQPLLSHPAGYYPDSILVTISSPVTGAQIYYTLDGTTPTQSSTLYVSPIKIKNNSSAPDNFSLIPTNPGFNYPQPGFDANRANSRGWLPPYSISEKVTVLKAILFKSGFVSDSAATATYILRQNLNLAYTLPVISLSVDSLNFFSEQTGIYVYGLDTVNEGNYGRNDSKKIFLEFFETGGSLKLSQYCDARIHGHGGRHAPQKSLQLIAQKEYGEGKFNYQVFPNSGSKKFDRLLLRNSGHRPDCVPRDDVGGVFLKGLDNEVQNARQCIVFLNGEYWGIQTLKEILDDNFLSNKFHWQNVNSVLLTQTGTLDEGYPGEEAPYQDLLSFVLNEDLAQSENYNYIWTQIDKKTFVDFQCTHIFLGNGDWPDNNTKFWRFKNGPNFPGANNVTDGRWRWMIFDLDAAFGGDCFAPSVSYNALNKAFDPQYGSYTRIMRKLIVNDTFKTFFINRYADLLNSDFLPSRLYSAIQTVKNSYDPEMNAHVMRWRYPSDSTTLAGRLFEPPTLNKWSSINTYLSSFAALRDDKTRNQFMNYFSLTDTIHVSISLNDSLMGKIKINSLYLDKNLARESQPVYPWQGVYFKGNALTLEALPFPGYKLRDWNNPGDTARIKTILANSDTSINAFFETDTSYKPFHYLFINELMSNNTLHIFDEYMERNDWIELYNPNNFPVDLNGFYLSDAAVDKQKFKVDGNSEQTTILPKGFIILWADEDSTQGKLHANFKLSSNGEELYLTAPDGISPVDSIIFSAADANTSFGRSTDAENDWITFSIPTPNTTNRIIEAPDALDFYIYPNPIEKNSTLTLSKHMTIELFDVTGRLVLEKANAKSVDLTGLSKGIYFVRPQDGKTQKLLIQ
jgi:hypothetical protein